MTKKFIKSIQGRLVLISIFFGVLMLAVSSTSIFFAHYLSLKNSLLADYEKRFDGYVSVSLIPTYELLRINGLLETRYLTDFLDGANQPGSAKRPFGASAKFIDEQIIEEATSQDEDFVVGPEALKYSQIEQSENCSLLMLETSVQCLAFFSEIGKFYSASWQVESLSKQTIQEIYMDVFYLFIVLLILVFLELYFLNKYLTKPVHDIAVKLKKSTLDEPIDLPESQSSSELSTIASSVWQFATRIRNLTVSVEVLNAEVERRKQAEVEKETLIQEVHHRVKNNLQVILSMLSLQKRVAHGDHEVFALNESSRRVRVMAKLYEHLYQSDNVRDIEPNTYLSDVLQDGLHAAGASDAVKANLDCAPVSLRIKTATALAQILSELVSNCIKHAFPDGKGKIDISLKRLENSSLQLTVRDNGIGLPEGFDEKKLRSMGIKLVRALVSQLDGKMTITSDNGTKVEIIFPEEK